MSFTQDLEPQATPVDAPRSEVVKLDDVVFPPGDLESNEPPLESDLHRDQIDLLIRLLRWWWREGSPAERRDAYISGNLTIYYSPQQRKSENFRGPDFFVVLGCDSRPRKSWVLWEENGQYPNVIIELLSDSTADVDRGAKKQLYQDTFRTPEYFWFHPNTLEFKGFELLRGQYEAIEPNPQGWLWSHQLQLFLGIHQNQLRFFTAEQALISTPEETALQAQQRAESAEELLARYRERFGELSE